MDVADVEKRITDKTKAIIPVHYAGCPCDMDALLAIKDKHGIRIVEDAAHAIGSRYKGRKIGSFGDVTCFSFDSIKVMTCGEGGAVVTHDNDLSDVMKIKRLLGIDRKAMHTKDWKQRSWIYDVSTVGYRYHMSNINAGIGLAQLAKIETFISRRRDICNLYMQELENVSGIELPVCDFQSIAPFMFVIKVKNGQRDALKKYLMEHDIESGISYIPCHHFSLLNKAAFSLPITDEVFTKILCLPLHYELTDEAVKEVSNCIKSFFKGE